MVHTGRMNCLLLKIFSVFPKMEIQNKVFPAFLFEFDIIIIN